MVLLRASDMGMAGERWFASTTRQGMCLASWVVPWVARPNLFDRALSHTGNTLKLRLGVAPGVIERLD